MLYSYEIFFGTQKIFPLDWAKQIGQRAKLGPLGGNFALWGPELFCPVQGDVRTYPQILCKSILSRLNAKHNKTRCARPICSASGSIHSIFSYPPDQLYLRPVRRNILWPLLPRHRHSSMQLRHRRIVFPHSLSPPCPIAN